MFYSNIENNNIQNFKVVMFLLIVELPVVFNALIVQVQKYKIKIITILSILIIY